MRPLASFSCDWGGERGEGGLTCFPSISEEAEAIDRDKGVRCGDEGRGGGLEAASVSRVQGMGSVLNEVRGEGGEGLMAMGASACVPLCWAL